MNKLLILLIALYIISRKNKPGSVVTLPNGNAASILVNQRDIADLNTRLYALENRINNSAFEI